MNEENKECSECGGDLVILSSGSTCDVYECSDCKNKEYFDNLEKQGE